MNKKRVFYLDFLRFFAIIAIIATHIGGQFAKPNPEWLFCNFWYFAIILRFLGWVGVPVFLMISGALLFKRRESVVEFLKKRYKRVLIPALFWFCIFLAFMCFCSSIGYLDFNMNLSLDFIINTFIGNYKYGAYFWYVPVILVMYLLIALINKIMRKYENFLKYLLYISIFLVIFHQFYPIFGSFRAWNLNYIIFPIFGYYLFTVDLTSDNLLKHVKLTDEMIAISSLIIFLVSYGIIIFYAVKSYTDPTIVIDHHFGIFNIIACVSIFLFFKHFEKSGGLLGRIFSFIKGNFSKIIYSVSVCSYGMYLSHKIIQYSIIYFLPATFFNGHNIVCMVTWYILVFLISWIIILILSKIPYIKEISGVG